MGIYLLVVGVSEVILHYSTHRDDSNEQHSMQGRVAEYSRTGSSPVADYQ